MPGAPGGWTGKTSATPPAVPKSSSNGSGDSLVRNFRNGPRGHRGDIGVSVLPARALAELAYEQSAGAAEPGDPASYAGGGGFSGRSKRVDAGVRPATPSDGGEHDISQITALRRCLMKRNRVVVLNRMGQYPSNDLVHRLFSPGHGHDGVVDGFLPVGPACDVMENR